MEKEFIPYKLALELKELGFNEPCNTCYDKLEMTASYGVNVFDYKNYNTSGYMVSRPTFSQSARWFREKYGLYSTIRPFGKGINSFFTIIWEDDDFTSGTKEFTYEEAQLACLKKLIELCKNN